MSLKKTIKMPTFQSEKISIPDLHVVISLFFILIIIKTGMVLLFGINTPIVYHDEIFYAKFAESFFHSMDFTYQGNPSNQYPPLYSIFISIAYLFTDPHTSYFVIMLLNGILFSTIIFPIWLLSRMFLPRNEAFCITILTSFFLPYNYSYLFTVMSENLFFPIVISSIFLLLKSIKNNSLKYDVLCGFFFGLAYLTKTIGVALILIYFVCLIVSSFLKHQGHSLYSYHNIWEIYDLGKRIIKDLIKKWSVIVIFVLTISPWIIRNIFLFTSPALDPASKVISGVVGRYENYSSDVGIGNIGDMLSFPFLLDFFKQLLLHLNYSILAINIILFIFVFYILFKIFKFEEKNDELILFVIATLALFAWLLIIASLNILFFNLANPDAFQYIRGRYVDPAMPLLILLGYIGINKYNEVKPNFSIFIIPLFFSASALLIAPLFFLLSPINSIMTQYLKNFTIYQYYLGIIIVTVIISSFLILKKNINIKKITAIFAIIFVFSSYSAYSFINWSSNTQFTPDQNEIIEWVNNQGFDEKTLFIVNIATTPDSAHYLSNALNFFTSARYCSGTVNPNENNIGQYIITDIPLNYSYLSPSFQTYLHFIYYIDQTKFLPLNLINVGQENLHPYDLNFSLPVHPQEYIILKEDSFSGFTNHLDGWGKFTDQMLSGANDYSTILASFENEYDNPYNIWVRTRIFDWSRSKNGLSIDNSSTRWIENEKGSEMGWRWQRIDNILLLPGEHSLQIQNGGEGYWSGLSTVLITNDLNYIPDDNFSQPLLPQNLNARGQPNMTQQRKGVYIWQDQDNNWIIQLFPDDNIQQLKLNILSDGNLNISSHKGIQAENFKVSNNSLKFFYRNENNYESGFNITSEGDMLHFSIQVETP